MDFTKLVTSVISSAKAAADGDAAEADRAVEGLNSLRKRDVTAALLMETEAGKKIRKLNKHSNPDVASAASEVVKEWKKKLKDKELERKSAKGGATLNGVRSENSNNAQEVKVKKESGNGGGAYDAERKGLPLSELKKTGDPVRDNIRKKLAEALMVEHADAGGDPNKSACEIETAVFKQNGGVNQGFKSKVRTLLFNLKDAKNTTLRTNILQRQMSGDVLVTLDARELANDEKRAENEKIREMKLKECERGTMKATTDAFQCGRCKQRKCVYYQMQTRSADEPMTTFVTCTNCGHRWKFC